MAVPDARAEPGGVPLGNVAGAPVVVSGWWFAVAAFITLVFAPGFRDSHPDLPAGSEYLLAATLVLLLYASVFLHELGHAFAARAYGIPVLRVRLEVLGGLTEMSRPAGTPWREAVVAGAGPAVSVVLAVVSVLGWGASPEGSLVRLVLGQLALVNVLVSVFNLLPGLPLDGGSLLRSLAWALTGSRSTATFLAAWAGRAVAVVTALLPLLVAWAWGGRPTLLGAVWFVLIAASIWFGASASLKQERFRRAAEGLQVDALMRRAVAVDPGTPVDEVVAAVTAAGAGAAVTVDVSGRPTAVVDEDAVAAVPPERRPHVPAAAVARQLQPGPLLTPEVGGEALLQHLTARPGREHVVVHGTTVVGVLRTADVDRAQDVRASRDGR